MDTRRTIKWLLVPGSFILLLSACSTRHVPSVATHQSVHIPLGTTLLAPPSASSVFTVAWSPDGQRIASVDDHLRVWQAS